MAGLAVSSPIDPPHLPWLVYTSSPDGFSREHPMGRNPNVMGYPFPPSTRAVGSFILVFLLFLSFVLFICIPRACLNTVFFSNLAHYGKARGAFLAC